MMEEQTGFQIAG